MEFPCLAASLTESGTAAVTHYKLIAKTVRNGFWQGLTACFFCVDCGRFRAIHGIAHVPCRLHVIPGAGGAISGTYEQPASYRSCSGKSPQEMDNGNFAKLSAACGFALKVVKYQNDDRIAEVIEERENTDSDTASFITAYTHFEFMYEKNSKEVNIMNGLERREQKMMVLAVIEALKNQGNSDETIVNSVTKQFQVTPDYVRDLMKEWPNPLLEKVKARAPSVPAGA